MAEGVEKVSTDPGEYSVEAGEFEQKPVRLVQQSVSLKIQTGSGGNHYRVQSPGGNGPFCVYLTEVSACFCVQR